ncbi:MAG: GAF domain-containing protein, partial [Candidatus Zixiibacteriota bacterium]
ATLRPVQGITPADGTMILSMMPLHCKVRDNNGPVLVNPEEIECKMLLSERRQLCSAHMNSALLVPLTIGEEVMAVISLAELRHWSRSRYTPADLAFVSTVAAALSLAMQAVLSGRSRGVLPTGTEDRFADTSPSDMSMRGRVRSSLSSILGSVELIRHRQPVSDRDLDRYLTIIDRSAQRICDLVREKPGTE